MHRDIKPQNFVYITTNWQSDLKTIDFGFGKRFRSCEKSQHDIVGTASYVAPEVIKGNFDMMCDNWSLGVLMYVILSG